MRTRHWKWIAIEHYWQVTDDHVEAAIGADRTEASAEADDTCTEASGTCPQSGASGGGTRRQVVTETAITVLSRGEADVKLIQAAWAKLPGNIRAAILTLVGPFSKPQSKAGNE
jgi:hypothetical protein